MPTLKENTIRVKIYFFHTHRGGAFMALYCSSQDQVPDVRLSLAGRGGVSRAAAVAASAAAPARSLPRSL